MTNTLRRACDNCIRVKRRCDRRLPRCTRCVTKGIGCAYVNTPLGGEMEPSSHSKYEPRKRVSITPRIHLPLQVEVIKVHEPPTVHFLVDRIGEFPIAFAQTMKTSFIHPDLYGSSIPAPIRDLHAICRLHLQIGHRRAIPSIELRRLLSGKSAEISRRAKRPSTFTELLADVQALILAHCILLSGNGKDEDCHELSCDTLLDLARQLWHQAPIQLPHDLDPYQAWLFAENVRRTIIMAFILSSTSSLKTKNYSIRTPFVDALPFDLRTSLWDESYETWERVAHATPISMVSLHEYTDMLEKGRITEVSGFGRLIWAACRGLSVSNMQYFPLPLPNAI